MSVDKALSILYLSCISDYGFHHIQIRHYPKTDPLLDDHTKIAFHFKLDYQENFMIKHGIIIKARYFI